jgi:DNA-binding SARP family transcriptional activator
MRAQQNRPAVQQPSYQAPEVKKELELQNRVKAWIESKNEDQELYNNLTAIYYNSGDITKFAQLLNEFNNELYEECKRQVG